MKIACIHCTRTKVDRILDCCIDCSIDRQVDCDISEII